jgi:hypothetical protein
VLDLAVPAKMKSILFVLHAATISSDAGSSFAGIPAINLISLVKAGAE